MKPDLLFEIADMALSVLRAQVAGTDQRDTLIEETLIDIVHMGAQAYQQHTGEPLDTREKEK
jgi:hypothetical protein